MPATGDLFAAFHEKLSWKQSLPGGISIINPYHEPEVKRVLRKFCDSFYGNENRRVLILGINPGRFGAGVTGIPFTDPIALEQHCGISNNFEKRFELSSRFIYEMIHTLGTPEYFYDHFILSAVCPLGFLNGTKNYNYYDNPDLLKTVNGFITASLTEQAGWNVSRKLVIVLGKKNSVFLEKLNQKLKLFENIITLEHPRYIMQYRLRLKNTYLESFGKQLQSATGYG